MTMSTPSHFAIPNEMRAVAERSVELTKLALNTYLRAAYQAVAAIGDAASPGGAPDINKKAINFAERNVLSAFEFAQRLIQAQDLPEVVRLLTEFLQSQTQVLAEQAKDMGDTVAGKRGLNGRRARGRFSS
jgi:hypothetical protein